MISKIIPEISIISASYNHQKYIANFIKSILNQTFSNFELIIIDDASTDNNLRIIDSFKDPRIKVIKHKYNLGPSISLNDGIRISRGKYISILSTDDEALPTYLQSGLDFLNKNQKYGALCFQLIGIDENGCELKNSAFQETLKFKNLDHNLLLNKMFTTGNMIPAPGEIIRKSLINKIGLFNPALFQTQDYDFHIRTLSQTKIHVLQQPLIKYRQHNNGQNIDSHSPISSLRLNLELPFVLDNFLNLNTESLNQVFKDEIKTYGKMIPKTIPFFLAIIAVNTSDSIRQQWGYQTLLKYIQTEDNLKLLNRLYSFQYKDIISLVKKIVHPNSIMNQIHKLLKNNF